LKTPDVSTSRRFACMKGLLPRLCFIDVNFEIEVLTVVDYGDCCVLEVCSTVWYMFTDVSEELAASNTFPRYSSKHLQN
jgi:hypothetical protein